LASSPAEAKAEAAKDRKSEIVGQYVKDLIGLQWAVILALEKNWFQVAGKEPLVSIMDADFEILIYLISVNSVYQTQ
jgi:hypothetical protein